MSTTKFETLCVKFPKPFVAAVEFNRPERLNAFSKQMWEEIGLCFEGLGRNQDCRSIVLSANGKHFTAGIDLLDMLATGQQLADIEDLARKGKFFEIMIKKYQVSFFFSEFQLISKIQFIFQDSISSLENCDKPVIVCVHQACVGAGVDLITAADIRYCTKDAWFQVKEVDIGMAADVGTLQRLPKVIGNQSLVRELCFTARKMKSDEARAEGLVSRVFDTKESMLEEAIKLAELIASKSPLAVQATKRNIVYSMDRTNQDGLDQIREINKLNLQSEDFVNACIAQQSKDEMPIFAKL